MGGFWSRISEKKKKKSKSRLTENKICHFWEFHKSPWINSKNKSRVTRIKQIPQSQIMIKMVKERKKNVCVAVKMGVSVRRNCNVVNLAMENVLKGLPDKIRALQMYTLINHGRWYRCSCIHTNDAELFVNVWHQLNSFQRQDDQEMHAI